MRQYEWLWITGYYFETSFKPVVNYFFIWLLHVLQLFLSDISFFFNFKFSRKVSIDTVFFSSMFILRLSFWFFSSVVCEIGYWIWRLKHTMYSKSRLFSDDFLNKIRVSDEQQKAFRRKSEKKRDEHRTHTIHMNTNQLHKNTFVRRICVLCIRVTTTLVKAAKWNSLVFFSLFRCSQWKKSQK